MVRFKEIITQLTSSNENVVQVWIAAYGDYVTESLFYTHQHEHVQQPPVNESDCATQASDELFSPCVTWSHHTMWHWPLSVTPPHTMYSMWSYWEPKWNFFSQNSDVCNHTNNWKCSNRKDKACGCCLSPSKAHCGQFGPECLTLVVSLWL